LREIEKERAKTRVREEAWEKKKKGRDSRGWSTSEA